MNSSTPAPLPGPDPADMNNAITRRLQSYQWKGRLLTTIALGVGLLSILAGILVAWANAIKVMPMERLLLQDYPSALSQNAPDSIAAGAPRTRPPLPRAELEWRHVQVTAAHGKAMFLMGASVALLGVGTFLTLLLVILNRHVTLQQINSSLAQISNQMRQLQDGKGPDAAR